FSNLAWSFACGERHHRATQQSESWRAHFEQSETFPKKVLTALAYPLVFAPRIPSGCGKQSLTQESLRLD
ncbi:MAG: hypothetical protein WCF18_09410, partial [Chthoniobacteraceae bacterium]